MVLFGVRVESKMLMPLTFLLMLKVCVVLSRFRAKSKTNWRHRLFLITLKGCAVLLGFRAEFKILAPWTFLLMIEICVVFLGFELKVCVILFGFRPPSKTLAPWTYVLW